MAALTGKYGLASSSNGEPSEQPLEKESLQSADLEKGISFFKDQCVIRVANQLELRQKAYEYVHKIYQNKGYAKNGSGNLWLSIYDALPNTITLIAEAKNGDIGGTLTLVSDSQIGLPSDELYGEEIGRLRDEGRKINEIISFGIDGSERNSFRLLAALFYCAYLVSWHEQKKSDFVITVNPRHEKFYCDKLLFTRIGPVRNYAKVNGAPAILLNLPLSLPNSLKEKKRIFPLFLLNYSCQEEIELSNKLNRLISPMTDEEFYTFFIDKTDAWERANLKQKDFIKKVYPPHKVNHNEVSRAFAKGLSKKQSVL